MNFIYSQVMELAKNSTNEIKNVHIHILSFDNDGILKEGNNSDIKCTLKDFEKYKDVINMIENQYKMIHIIAVEFDCYNLYIEIRADNNGKAPEFCPLDDVSSAIKFAHQSNIPIRLVNNDVDIIVGIDLASALPDGDCSVGFDECGFRINIPNKYFEDKEI